MSILEMLQETKAESRVFAAVCETAWRKPAYQGEMHFSEGWRERSIYWAFVETRQVDEVINTRFQADEAAQTAAIFVKAVFHTC